MSVDWSAEQINEYVRNRFREARRQKGATQGDIARLLGKTRVAISDVERGRVNISVSDLSRVACYFELPIAYFFPPYNSVESRLSPLEEELLLAVRQLSEVDQHVILEQTRDRHRLVDRARQSLARRPDDIAL